MKFSSLIFANLISITFIGYTEEVVVFGKKISNTSFCPGLLSITEAKRKRKRA
jgi:hypothetical protein